MKPLIVINKQIGQLVISYKLLFRSLHDLIAMLENIKGGVVKISVNYFVELNFLFVENSLHRISEAKLISILVETTRFCWRVEFASVVCQILELELFYSDTVRVTKHLLLLYQIRRYTGNGLCLFVIYKIGLFIV